MPAASILDPNNKTPGLFLRVSLGVGPQTAADDPIQILVLGNRLSTGTRADSSVLPVYGEDEARSYYGQGSELHRMLRALFKAHPTATVDAGVIAESAGANASLNTIVFSGGPATAAGTVYVYIAGTVVTAPVASGDNVTTIAASVVTAINNAPDLPVTATSSVGTVTVTARQKGPRGNWIRVRTAATIAGVTHTAIDAYLAGGTTSDNATTVLANAAGKRYHVIVSPYEDATGIGYVDSHVTAMSDVLEAKRGVYVCASADTLGNATTIAQGKNAARGRMIWHYASEVSPCELAASYGGVYARGLGIDRAYNYDGVMLPAGVVQYTGADRPTSSEIASALSVGLTPLAPKGNGVSIVRAVTMRSKDSGGKADYSVLDVHKVDVPDFIADELGAVYESTFGASSGVEGGFRLAAAVDGEMPPDGVATEATIKDLIVATLRRFDAQSSTSEAAYLVDLDATEEATVVSIDPITNGRVNASIPLDVVELLHQSAFDIRQIG